MEFVTVPALNPSGGPVSARMIFTAGCNFYNAAVGLMHNIDPKNPQFFRPFTVMSAFSVELFLKCLLLEESGSYPETHDLKELYRNVRKTTRLHLAKKYKAGMSADESGRYRLKIGDFVDLETDLEHSKDAFILMRYEFEGAPLNNNGFCVHALSHHIATYLLGIHPGWQ